MDSAQPILIFDSGVGGLSVLQEIRKALPLAPLVYAADNGWHPYGTKTEAEISARVPALLGRLAERVKPRLIVIACNTACTIALADIRAALNLPIVGTVPAVKPAGLASKTRVVGILGTNATVRQPYVDRLIAEFAQDCLVLRLGSAELVRIAEEKLRGQAPDPAQMKDILAELYDQTGGDRIDQLVLACTHFPLLKGEITAASPNNVVLVDSGAGIARRTAFLTKDQKWPASQTQGLALFTQEDDNLELLRPALQGYGLNRVGIL